MEEFCADPSEDVADDDGAQLTDETPHVSTANGGPPIGVIGAMDGVDGAQKTDEKRQHGSTDKGGYDYYVECR